MKKEEILSEIKRIATQNGGAPPGKRMFAKETGIREHEWSGVYWARWGDALEEAGFTPNSLVTAFDKEHVLRKLAEAFRHFRKMPTVAELRLYRRNCDPEFPSEKVFRREGHRGIRDWPLREFVESHPEFSDLLSALPPIPESSSPRIVVGEEPVEGHVYLIRWSNHYKIGRTDNLERRFKEIRTNLPSRGEIIHAIRTDDPAGIEAYWHKRFADKRAENGEWFSLAPADVRIFKRRKFM